MNRHDWLENISYRPGAIQIVPLEPPFELLPDLLTCRQGFAHFGRSRLLLFDGGLLALGLPQGVDFAQEPRDKVVLVPAPVNVGLNLLHLRRYGGRQSDEQT